MPKVTLERGILRLQMQIWLWLTKLLSLQLVKTAELDPSQNYFAGFHPHRVLATRAFVDLCAESMGFQSSSPASAPT